MAATIYARQVPPEYQESTLFWEGLPEGLEIAGNPQLQRHTSPLFDRLPEILGDLARAWYDFTDGRPAPGYDSWAEALADIAPPEGRPEYTRQERKNDWPAVAMAYFNADCSTTEAYAAALTLITGQKWDFCTLRGNCQSDWQEFIFCTDLWNRDRLERLESEYFNTGTEWIIHDDDTPPDSPEEINGFSVYCTEWNDDGIRREIAEAAACAGLNPGAVKLYKFAGFTQIAQYEEVTQ